MHIRARTELILMVLYTAHPPNNKNGKNLILDVGSRHVEENDAIHVYI